MPKNSYDEVPYTSHPCRQSHPERMATIASLFGLKTAPIDQCRVLEIGCAAGGNLLPMADCFPEIHKPQVWVSRCDSEQAAQLLVEFEHSKAERDIDNKRDEQKDISVECEDCNKISMFAGSLNGSLQDCPHCGAYIDVGEFEWPAE